MYACLGLILGQFRLRPKHGLTSEIGLHKSCRGLASQEPFTHSERHKADLHTDYMEDVRLLTGLCMLRCSSRPGQPACQTSRRLWSRCDRLCRSTPTLAARPAPHTLTTTSPACSWSASLSRTILPTLYSPLPDGCIGWLLHNRKDPSLFHLLDSSVLQTCHGLARLC